jgi:hypothetical protein
MQNFRRAVSCLVLMAASFVSLGASAAPFVVDVATGGAGLPVARMKVVLWGGYAAGVSASVSVTGGATGSATLPVGTDKVSAGVGNDALTLTHAGNDLVLDMKLLSLVADATDLCTAKGGVPNPKTYTINVTGGGTVTQYGLAGYSATSEASCTCANRRKASGVAWQAGSTPPGTARRIPFNVMTVLDESGSMLSPPQGGAPPSKWALTAQAMGEFTDILSGEADSPDQLGVVFFDHNVNPFVNAGSPWFPKASFPTIETEVSAGTHPRAGATSIGGGLKSALESSICKKESDPIGDPTILLMSDGMQNTAPQVNDGVDGDLDFKILNYSTACPAAAAEEQRLTHPCIPVLTLYLDLPAGTPAATLMQAISDQTAGASAWRAQMGATAAGAFGSTLVGMLKGSSLSLLASSIETLPKGQQTGTPMAFDFDGTVKRLIVVLGWQPTEGLENALIFGAAGGQGGTPNASLRNLSALTHVGTVGAAPGLRQTPYYIVAAADLPPATTTTSFELFARRSPILDGGGPAIPYHLFVYAVESQFEFVPSFPPGRHGTGEPLVLNLDLSLNRAPIGATGNTIQVSVDGPTGAIGTLLHNLPDPGGQGAPGETANESAADKKINNLNKSPEVLEKTLPKSTGQALSFVDLGGGRLQLRLNETRVPGAYVFHLALDVNGPAGRIHRTESVETQVEVLPDATQVTVNKAADGSYTVNVIPMDQFKNYLGPGFEPQIQLTLPSGVGKIASVSDVGVDGSYTILVTDIPDGVDPEVVLNVTGVTVAKGPLSEIGRPAGGTHGSCWCGALGHQTGGAAAPLFGAVCLFGALGLRRGRPRRDSKDRAGR